MSLLNSKLIAAKNGRGKKSNSKFSCVDTAVISFGARDYDSTVGRWTTKDPIGFNGGDTNLYAYVGGNPMSYNDPTGNCPMCLVPVIGAAVGGVSSFTGTLIGGGSVSDAFVSARGGVLAGGLAGLTAVFGGGTLLAGAVATGVDVLYGVLTSVDAIPGSQPVQNFNNGINIIQNPNRRNDPNNQCDQKK